MSLTPDAEKEGLGSLHRTYTFKKKQRIYTKSEFAEVFEYNFKLIGRAIIIYYRPYADYKAGFIVSKKVSNRATKRNKIKRILREIFRLSETRVPGKYIFIARGQSIQMDYAEIARDFDKLISRIKQKHVQKTHSSAS